LLASALASTGAEDFLPVVVIVRVGQDRLPWWRLRLLALLIDEVTEAFEWKRIVLSGFYPRKGEHQLRAVYKVTMKLLRLRKLITRLYRLFPRQVVMLNSLSDHSGEWQVALLQTALHCLRWGLLCGR